MSATAWSRVVSKVYPQWFANKARKEVGLPWLYGTLAVAAFCTSVFTPWLFSRNVQETHHGRLAGIPFMKETPVDTSSFNPVQAVEQ